MNSRVNIRASGFRRIRHKKHNQWHKKEGILHVRTVLGKILNKKWESKLMYGQYVESKDRQLVGG